MKFLQIALAIALAALLAESALAGKGHTSLLATSQPLEGGITADLFLETKPGTGKVFIDSNPLTRLDTQISTRFAKEIACSYLGEDCRNVDFFYTIKADAVIVGGPSAGAAIAALTVSVLKGVELNQSVAITGTINSGNLVGSVAGIPEKIEAASQSGLRKVLIPKGENFSFEPNASADAHQHALELGVEVVEVFTLDEVMKEFTGRSFRPPIEEIDIDGRYSATMAGLSSELCNRTRELAALMKETGEEEVREKADNLTMQGAEATREGSFYAAASYCFGANVRYNYLDMASKNLTDTEIKSELDEVSRKNDDFEKNLGDASTVSDVQILALVLERVGEVRDHVNESESTLEDGNLSESVFQLAFAVERLKSAEAWSSFLGVLSEVGISEDMVMDACLDKLAEARERVGYASIIIQSTNHSSVKKLADAERFVRENSYLRCLHKATLAKAEATTLLSIIGVTNEEIPEVVDRKIDAAKASISRQAGKGIFPIVGYSYYEYAGSLKDKDPYSALLFSDYALEFSNPDIYFKPVAPSPDPAQPVGETEEESGLGKTASELAYFALGILTGLVLAVALGFRRVNKKRVLKCASRTRRKGKLRK